jgi:hypothetical protein
VAENPEICKRTGVIRIERRNYRGWKNAYLLSNGIVELVVLADVGPRIVRYSFCGGENQFHEFREHAGKTGGKDFRLYGGHRFWIWPEVETTYYPDNVAVAVSELDCGLLFSAPSEDDPPGIGIKKQVAVRMVENSTRITVSHEATNQGETATRLAPWAPTVLKPGGRAILPFPPRVAMDKQHFRSVGPLTLWSFTDFSDARWKLGREFLQLEHQSNLVGRFPEQMTGLFNPAEWGVYYRSGALFLKRAGLVPAAAYPDYGCNFEIFTNSEFLELETLGPIVELKPGESTTHTEDWWLFENVPPGEDESWVRSAILPLVEQTGTK